MRTKYRYLLEKCLEILELPVDSVRVTRCVEESMGHSSASTADGTPIDWQVTFAQACKLYGLRAEIGILPCERIPELASQEKPVVVFQKTAQDQSGFAILTDYWNNQVKVERPNGRSGDWVSLGTFLGFNPDKEELPFVSVSPRTGMAGAPPDNGHDSHGDDGHHGRHGMSPLKRFLELIQPDWRDIRVVVVFAFFVAMLSLAAPITTAALVNSVQGGTGIILQVIVLTSVLFVCLSLAGIMRALKAWVVEYLQQRIFVRVTDDLSYRLPIARISSFDGQNGMELVNRFFDVMTVQKAGAVLLVDGLTVVVNSIAGLIILGFYSRFLLGFDIALTSAMVFFIYVMGIGAVRTSINESLAKYRVAGWLEEVMRNPVSFRGWGGRELAQARADSLTQEYLLARKAHFRILFRQICFSLGLQAVASAALLGLGGWLVIEGQLSIGQLVAAELIVSVVVGSAVKLTKSLESYYDLMAAMDKLGHLFDLPLEREGGELFPKTQGPAGLEIKGWSSHLGHHSHDHHHDHHTVSLSIKPGEKIALAGTTGTGKSLLLQSIVGLRESHGGRIMIEGVDLRQLDLSALRERVVLVSGKEIVQGTLFENIRMGRPEIRPEQVRKALKAVGLENWAADLPKGWDTILVSGGSILSSGETIQILLARAMVGKPSLLILDGVLDGLASPLREDLARLVTSHEQNWTLLLVTNHPDIAGLCDREIVLGHSHGETHS